MSCSDSPLLARVEKLPPVQRAVLEIAALYGDGLTLRRLIEIGRPLTAGEEFAPTRLGPVLDSLIGQGLLREEDEILSCAPGLEEPVCLQARIAERAPLVATQILKLEPWTSRKQSSPEALWRDFRLHLYGGQARQANGLASDLERHGRNAWSQVGRALPDAESLLAFPPELALTLARETVIQSLNKAFPAPHAVAALGQLVAAAGPKEQQLYAHTLMMMDRQDELDAFLAQHDFPTLEGCRKILRGDLRGLADFERGLRDSKFFPSYTALFLYLVALLAAEGQDSSRLGQAIERYEVFRVPFRWLLAVKSGQLNGLSPEMRQKVEEAPDAIIPHYSLILYWAGFRFDQASLAEKAQLYRQAGYAVFAGWLSCAAHGDTAGASRPPLLELLQADSQWRKALDALDAWSAPERDLVATPERLVWHIEPFVANRAVEPRLQRMSKRGGWSGGRLLGLEDLWVAPPACSDAHDHKVLDALQRLARGPTRFGYVTRGEQHDAALLALAGHPRVYLKKSPDHPVELEVRPVGLSVRRFEGYLELKVEPHTASMAMVTASSAGPGKVSLFHFTERHVQLCRLIDSGLRIPLEGEPQLRRTLAGLATAGLVLRSDIELDGEAQEGEADACLLVRLSPYSDGLAVAVRVAPLGEGGPLLLPGEGSPVVAARFDDGSHQVRRDLALERQRWSELQELHPRLLAPDFILPTPLECLAFLEGFAGQQDPRYRLQWPEGERYAVTLKLRVPDLKQRVRRSGDWFSIGADVRVDEGLVLSLGALLEARRQAFGRFVPLEGGRFVALSDELERHLDRLDRLSQRLVGGEVQLHPLNALLVLDEHEVQADEAWTSLRERLEGSQRLQPSLPSTLRGQLRDYQADGVRWLLRLAHWGVGACLADDMGLGKTVQLLTMLLARAAEGPALVVAPTSVCWNWADEAARFAPSLRVRSLDQTTLESLGPRDLLVTSYGLLVNHAEALREVRWATVVLDEAQAIKNAHTQRARAAHQLPAGFRVAATGTPVENHPDEMWALFRFLNPGLLGSHKAFQRRFASPAGQQELARLVRPFILRRSKEQVLTELPARTEILERIRLSEPERALYESMRREAIKSLEQDGADESYLSVLAHLSRLRQACCHPRLVFPESSLPGSKLERCLELVRELRENGHRALLFSQFVSHLQLVREALDQAGVSYAYLDGSTPPAVRRKAVKAFQGGEGDVFLISLKAGGTGLNLTAADYVLHLDPWWNPAVEDQASDRAHRMGQRRPVTVYRLIAQDTIEEQIVALHREKRDLAERLLEGTDDTHRLSAADLLDLLKR